jgi:hypothetical protein
MLNLGRSRHRARAVVVALLVIALSASAGHAQLAKHLSHSYFYDGALPHAQVHSTTRAATDQEQPPVLSRSSPLWTGPTPGVSAFAAEGVSAAPAELPPAVIGEGMGSRVIPFAEEHGYEYYSGVSNPADFTSEELLGHNRAQIEQWISEGRKIIDIGPEPGRAFYPLETSPNYAMERNIVRGYSNYVRHILDGEGDWEAWARGN